MAMSSLSLSWFPATLAKELKFPHPNEVTRASTSLPGTDSIACSTRVAAFGEESNCSRRPLLLGIGALTTSLLPIDPVLAEEIPKNYRAFVDREDGYSYYHPRDWVDFDFRGHDSAFKDRVLAIQNVRVRFIPTEKKDIHDLGPLDEVVYNLVKHVYPAPTQVPTIYTMEERSIDGKNYYFFEYNLTSPNYASVSFANIAIANGRYYTMIVGANERRWRRVRDKLKVIADSFRVFDI